MKRYLYSALLLALFSSAAVRAASKQQSTKAEPPQPAAQQTHAAPPGGEEVFSAHCARCHAAPMSISQRTTGTVIMHMRARARLSREDEIQLLKYMAP
jgi:cytochrome c5